MIRLTDLYNVLGRRLACRLLEAKYIVPTARDARGHPLFDAVALHRTLGAVAPSVGLVEPRTYRSGNEARSDNKKKTSSYSTPRRSRGCWSKRAANRPTQTKDFERFRGTFATLSSKLTRLPAQQFI